MADWKDLVTEWQRRYLANAIADVPKLDIDAALEHSWRRRARLEGARHNLVLSRAGLNTLAAAARTEVERSRTHG